MSMRTDLETPESDTDRLQYGRERAARRGSAVSLQNHASATSTSSPSSESELVNHHGRNGDFGSNGDFGDLDIEEIHHQARKAHKEPGRKRRISRSNTAINSEDVSQALEDTDKPRAHRSRSDAEESSPDSEKPKRRLSRGIPTRTSDSSSDDKTRFLRKSASQSASDVDVDLDYELSIIENRAKQAVGSTKSVEEFALLEQGRVSSRNEDGLRNSTRRRGSAHSANSGGSDDRRKKNNKWQSRTFQDVIHYFFQTFSYLYI